MVPYFAGARVKLLMQALREAFGPRAQMLRARLNKFLICALKLLILPRIALRVCAILLAAAVARARAFTRPFTRPGPLTGLHNFGLKREAGLIFAQHAALALKLLILSQRFLPR